MTNLQHDLDPERSLVLIVDLQERLVAAMQPQAWDAVARKTVTLIEGAKVLSVPVLATEQYSRGLGPTVSPVREVLPSAPEEKMDFSCWKSSSVKKRIEGHGRRQIVIAGMETHVCVFQTARDLVVAGYEVFVVSDCVLSRTEENRGLGLSLMAGVGAVVTGVEVVLFDWLGAATNPNFKSISKLVK